MPEAIELVIKPAAGGVKEKTRNKSFRNVRKQPPVGKVPKGLPPKAVSPEGTQSAVGNRASGRRYGSGVRKTEVSLVPLWSSYFEMWAIWGVWETPNHRFSFRWSQFVRF